MMSCGGEEDAPWHVKNPDSVMWKRWRTDKKDEATHLLLSGGKFNVPDSDAELMLRVIATMYRDINTYKHCLVERPTDITRLFFDFDIHAPEDCDHREVREWCRDFLLEVALYLSGQVEGGRSRFYMIVCRPHKVKFTNKGVVQFGYHVHVPMVYMNRETGLAFRNYLLDLFKNDKGVEDIRKRHASIGLNSWEEIIDERLFISNGLRVVGAQKVEICKHIGQEENVGSRDGPKCLTCWDKKWTFDNGRPYLLYGIVTFDNDGRPQWDKEMFDQFEEDPLRLATECSVRVIDKDINVTSTHLKAEYFKGVDRETPKLNRSKLPRVTVNSDKQEADKDTPVPITPACRTAIENFMEESAKRFPHILPAGIHKEIFSIQRRGEKNLMVVKTSSDCCGNKESKSGEMIGKHNTGYKLYALFGIDMMRVKCWCSCDSNAKRRINDDGRAVPCSAYSFDIHYWKEYVDTMPEFLFDIKIKHHGAKYTIQPSRYDYESILPPPPPVDEQEEFDEKAWQEQMEQGELFRIREPPKPKKKKRKT